MGPGHTIAVTRAKTAATDRVGFTQLKVSLESTEGHSCRSRRETASAASRASKCTTSEMRSKDMSEPLQVFRHASRRMGLVVTDLRLAGLLSCLPYSVGKAEIGWRREGNDWG